MILIYRTIGFFYEKCLGLYGFQILEDNPMVGIVGSQTNQHLEGLCVCKALHCDIVFDVHKSCSKVNSPILYFWILVKSFNSGTNHEIWHTPMTNNRGGVAVDAEGLNHEELSPRRSHGEVQRGIAARLGKLKVHVSTTHGLTSCIMAI